MMDDAPIEADETRPIGLCALSRCAVSLVPSGVATHFKMRPIPGPTLRTATQTVWTSVVGTATLSSKPGVVPVWYFLETALRAMDVTAVLPHLPTSSPYRWALPLL